MYVRPGSIARGQPSSSRSITAMEAASASYVGEDRDTLFGYGLPLPRSCLPFNSRRVTVAQLKKLGRALGVPTAASGEEVRQMIETKLEEQGREPRDVQVVLWGTGAVADVGLCDAEGTFLQAGAEVNQEIEEPECGQGECPDIDESDTLRDELEEASRRIRDLNIAVRALEKMLAHEKTRVHEMWKANCVNLAFYDEELAAKEVENQQLRELLKEKDDGEIPDLPTGTAEPGEGTNAGTSTKAPTPESEKTTTSKVRRGKAPPVDSYTGEEQGIMLDDWLPSLQRASTWNGWEESELLLQLAGHLRGRALQEWSLIGEEKKITYAGAVEALRSRLDPGSKALAAQDFRHISQNAEERVADYIRRLEHTFKVAYGRDPMSRETRDTLLHGQLQDGLKYELMQAPAVSGAQKYAELCLAARNEEKRLAELKKRQQYGKENAIGNQSGKKPSVESSRDKARQVPMGQKRCQVGHIAPFCRSKNFHNRGDSKAYNGDRGRDTRPFNGNRFHHENRGRDNRFHRESQGRGPGKPDGHAHQVDTKHKPTEEVSSGNQEETQEKSAGLLSVLLSSSEDESEAHVSLVRVHDLGSQSQCVKVEIQGVPAEGIRDSGADITIMGGDLFRRVAVIAKLRKRDLKNPDKIPRNYDQRPFKLDGRMDLDITFNGKAIRTPVYIKIDAHEQLLLSEGVCRQLEIIQYHPDVQPRHKGKIDVSNRPRMTGSSEGNGAIVPLIKVNLVQSVRILPGQSVMVPVQADRPHHVEEQSLLLEGEDTEQVLGIQVPSTLMQLDAKGQSWITLTNPAGFTQRVDAGVTLGVATEASVVELLNDDILLHGDSQPATVGRVVSDEEVTDRQKKLLELIAKPTSLTRDQRVELEEFLVENHDAFSLDPEERGETDLVQLEIHTGDAPPKKQPVRRMPFVVRQEIARQLKHMQATGVITPSSSPWASPVVLVRKKDGTHRFCIDYRQLNSVTKADRYPLPRIDDLLDQLEKSCYFSTLDLASGYWQIRVHPNSKEKTAFITPQGLYEFQVMPFGLTNAPAVFQRLMQRVLSGLNPEDGPDFVSVYIDDVLVFSRTWEEHLQHVRAVLGRLQEAKLKLKAVKCRFGRAEVEYLGHIITPQGLKTNPRLVLAVKQFPTPRNVREVRQFLGLSSYYRRFIPSFAKCAQPLHNLTRQGVQFKWCTECQQAFEFLKQRLIEAPVLAYPSFSKEFVLETDASIEGLGAVLSQAQGDGRLHPIAFASRALSQAERNYSITELETLAVVWAVSHFHYYLYNQVVTVYTDHTAVKAVLETPNPSGKHARWWEKVYGRGVKSVKIVYRPERMNGNADALSRNPQLSAPVDQLGDGEVQVAQITPLGDIEMMLMSEPMASGFATLAEEQRKDVRIQEVIALLEEGKLPVDPQRARRLALQQELFVLVEQVLYFVNAKHGQRKRAVLPCQLREQLMDEAHRGPMSGHFSGQRLYNTLSGHFWWEGMYTDVHHFVKSCPECAIVSGGGRVRRPPLHPIPVQRPFQIVGVDVMTLPRTAQGNQHVLVFQDFLTKWPMVYPIPDQKAERIVKILVEEIIPSFGIPESLLSDRGTNLLSHLMLDVCKLLGIRKLNTTAYHPQADGLVERYNRTLKAMLRKHAARFGSQWDQFLPGVQWAYRNTPHEATGEKPSFLLYGFDCRMPSEAAILPPSQWEPGDVSDYREELMISLASARELAAASIQRSQKRYKANYDRSASDKHYRVGDWVLVRFPQDESGAARKLSRPWHGPYRVVQCSGPDVTVVKIYRPQDGQIQVHQLRVTPCPPEFPAGYFWYGNKRHGPGRPPKWVDLMLNEEEPEAATSVEPPMEVLIDPRRGQGSKYNFRTRITPPIRLE